jgi:predicted RNase H-like nuclease
MSRLCAPEPTIGVDLAWGTKARTGVAVVDGAGRLVLVTSLITDDELDATLGPWLAGPCLVALDAPLIVVNKTGRRPCEGELTRAFAAQHAGTYPCNTGLPTFSDGGRAAGFARRHDLDIDATNPPGMGNRRALEVYPHSAAVALFDLPRVLPYKARKGRTLQSRRAALLELLALIAGLAVPVLSGAPGLMAPDGTFERMTRELEAAPTAAALRRLEDPIDAILCAYVGLLFRAGLTAVIGDTKTGAIVTPVRDRHRAILGLPLTGDR